MWSGHLSADAKLAASLKQLVGANFFLEISDGQGTCLSIDVGVIDGVAIDEQFVDGFRCGLLLRDVVVGEANLRAAVVVDGRLAQLADGLADDVLAGAVGVVADEDVVLVEMRRQAVDALYLLQALHDAVGTVLAVHVVDAQAHAAADSV